MSTVTATLQANLCVNFEITATLCYFLRLARSAEQFLKLSRLTYVTVCIDSH